MSLPDQGRVGEYIGSSRSAGYNPCGTAYFFVIIRDHHVIIREPLGSIRNGHAIAAQAKNLEN